MGGYELIKAAMTGDTAQVRQQLASGTAVDARDVRCHRRVPRAARAPARRRPSLDCGAASGWGLAWAAGRRAVWVCGRAGGRRHASVSRRAGLRAIARRTRPPPRRSPPLPPADSGGIAGRSCHAWRPHRCTDAACAPPPPGGGMPAGWPRCARPRCTPAPPRPSPPLPPPHPAPAAAGAAAPAEPRSVGASGGRGRSAGRWVGRGGGGRGRAAAPSPSASRRLTAASCAIARPRLAAGGRLHGAHGGGSQ